MSDKRVISKTLQVVEQFNNKAINNPILKWRKDLSFLKRRHTNRGQCSGIQNPVSVVLDMERCFKKYSQGGNIIIADDSSLCVFAPDCLPAGQDVIMEDSGMDDPDDV